MWLEFQTVSKTVVGVSPWGHRIPKECGVVRIPPSPPESGVTIVFFALVSFGSDKWAERQIGELQTNCNMSSWAEWEPGGLSIRRQNLKLASDVKVETSYLTPT